MDVNGMRAYIALMFAALVGVIVWTVVTQGFIHDRAWAEDCTTLAHGGSVSVSPDEFTTLLDMCNPATR